MNVQQKVAAGSVSLVLASASMLGYINTWEGRKYPVYLDIGGVPTVCEGHTGPEVIFGDTWTKQQCDAILFSNATKYGKAVLGCVSVPINQNQFDALTLFAINVGTNGMCASRAVREINKGNHSVGCNAIATDDKGKPAWSYVGKKYVPGLQRRRQFEKALCLKPMEKPTPLTESVILATKPPLPSPLPVQPPVLP